MDYGLIDKENLLNRLPFVRQILILKFSSQFHIFSCITIVLIKVVKPGLHIVVMVVSTVSNTFLTLFQAVLIHVNTLITTSQA